MDRKLRKAVEVLKIPPQSRTEQQIEQIVEATKQVRFFQQNSQKDGNNLLHVQCCRRMTIQQFPKGSFVCKYGQKGDAFYIILHGNVTVRVPTINLDQIPIQFQSTKPSQILSFKEALQIGPGGSFGDLALTSQAKRQASILCSTNIIVAVLSVADFKVIQKSYVKKLNEKIYFLRELPSFKGWTLVSLQKFAYCLKSEFFERNQKVFIQGDKANKVYIVKSGQFKITQKHTARNGSVYLKQRIDSSLSTRGNLVKHTRSRSLNRDLQINTLGVKEIIGIDDVLHKPHIRKFTCTSLNNGSELFVMSGKDFQQKMKHPQTRQFIDSFQSVHNTWLDTRIKHLKTMEQNTLSMIYTPLFSLRIPKKTQSPVVKESLQVKKLPSHKKLPSVIQSILTPSSKNSPRTSVGCTQSPQISPRILYTSPRQQNSKVEQTVAFSPRALKKHSTKSSFFPTEPTNKRSRKRSHTQNKFKKLI